MAGRTRSHAIRQRDAVPILEALMIFLLKSLEPETYDDEIRRAKWLADTGTQNPDAAPVQVIMLRDKAPEGVEKLAAIGADDGREH